MANEKNTKSTGEQARPETKAEPKFSVEKLGANCRQLFGVSSCTFAGATHGLTGTYTVAEMKAHIEKWRRMEVK